MKKVPKDYPEVMKYNAKKCQNVKKDFRTMAHPPHPSYYLVFFSPGGREVGEMSPSAKKKISAHFARHL